MSIAYSPLCDTSVSAYIAYCVANGGGAFSSGFFSGSHCSGQYVGGCVDYGRYGDTVSGGDDVSQARGRFCLCRFANQVGFFGGNDSGYGNSDKLLVGVSAGGVSGGNSDLSDNDGLCSDGSGVSKFEGRSELSDATVPVSVIASRGKHYLRNKAKAEKKKEKKRAAGVVVTGSSGSQNALGRQGYFSDCSEDVQVRLRESRAEMLIADNAARKAKAESVVRHYQMVKESRVNETKFEFSRQSSEEKLRKISEIRLGAGFVEGTVCSSAATPSLSSGSVSPNSSLSMAEVKRKDNLILDLERKLAEMSVSVKAKDKALDEARSRGKRADQLLAETRNNRAIREQLARQVEEQKFLQRGFLRNSEKSSGPGDGYSRWD